MDKAKELAQYLLIGMQIEPRLKLLFLTTRKLDALLLEQGIDRWCPSYEVTIYDRRLFLLAKKEQQLMSELGFTTNGKYPYPCRGVRLWT
tara:strand:+ start:2930 stop:3199 length:270 start_codon:yes stop_codon:yes gene_type:complete